MFESQDDVVETTYKAKKFGFKGLSDLIRYLVAEWMKNPQKRVVKEPQR